MILTLESIKYQHGSQFYRDLCNEFQKVLDYRTSLEESQDGALVSKTVAFYCDNTAPSMIKLIEKHTGLKTRHNVAKSPCAMFATLLLLPNDEFQMTDIAERITGLEKTRDHYVNTYGRKKPLTAEDLLENAEKLMLDTGRIATDINVDGCGYKTIIFSDPYCGILAPETVHTQLERFTAEELAAIILHEVGHNLTVIERMGDTYHRVNAMMTMMDGFKERASIDEQVKAAKALATKYKDDTVDYSRIDKILDKYEREYEALAGKEWTDRTGFLKVCITILCAVLWLVLLPVILLITMLTIVNSLGLRLDVNYGRVGPGNKSDGTKRGDVAATGQNLTMLERWADDYATRHGAGSALVTALAKFNALFATLRGGKDSSILRKSSVYYNASVLEASVLRTISAFGPIVTYKRDLDRYNDIAKTTLGMLRSEMDNPELRQLYMEQFETIRRHMERSFETKTVVRYVATITRLFDAALSSDWNSAFQRRYEAMLNDIDDMQHTPLYYYAAKFQELSGKNIS
jgi:hypothetical protein